MKYTSEFYIEFYSLCFDPFQNRNKKALLARIYFPNFVTLDIAYNAYMALYEPIIIGGESATYMRASTPNSEAFTNLIHTKEV